MCVRARQGEGASVTLPISAKKLFSHWGSDRRSFTRATTESPTGTTKPPSSQAQCSHGTGTDSLTGSEGGKSFRQPWQLLTSRLLGTQMPRKREEARTVLPPQSSHQMNIARGSSTAPDTSSAADLQHTGLKTNLLSISCDTTSLCQGSKQDLWLAGLLGRSPGGTQHPPIYRKPPRNPLQQSHTTRLRLRTVGAAPWSLRGLPLPFIKEGCGQLLSSPWAEGRAPARSLPSTLFSPRLGLAAQGTAGFLSPFPLLNYRKCPN